MSTMHGCFVEIWYFRDMILVFASLLLVIWRSQAVCKERRSLLAESKQSGTLPSSRKHRRENGRRSSEQLPVCNLPEQVSSSSTPPTCVASLEQQVSSSLHKPHIGIITCWLKALHKPVVKVYNTIVCCFLEYQSCRSSEA